jgi:hypothetical protein
MILNTGLEGKGLEYMEFYQLFNFLMNVILIYLRMSTPKMEAVAATFLRNICSCLAYTMVS